EKLGFDLDRGEAAGGEGSHQVFDPAGLLQQRLDIVEGRAPLGVLPRSIGPQKGEMQVPKRQQQGMGGARQFMHDENTALAQHGCSVGHQTVEVDILGKVVGDDAIKLPRHHHVFGPAVNELDIAQSKVADLLPGKVEISLVEFHSGYAAVGEAAGNFKGQNAG